MPVDNSRLKGFYKLSIPERRAMLAELAGLSEEQVQAWADAELDEDVADMLYTQPWPLAIGIDIWKAVDG